MKNYETSNKRKIISLRRSGLVLLLLTQIFPLQTYSQKCDCDYTQIVTENCDSLSLRHTDPCLSECYEKYRDFSFKIRLSYAIHNDGDFNVRNKLKLCLDSNRIADKCRPCAVKIDSFLLYNIEDISMHEKRVHSSILKKNISTSKLKFSEWSYTGDDCLYHQGVILNSKGKQVYDSIILVEQERTYVLLGSKYYLDDISFLLKKGTLKSILRNKNSVAKNIKKQILLFEKLLKLRQVPFHRSQSTDNKCYYSFVRGTQIEIHKDNINYCIYALIKGGLFPDLLYSTK